MGKYLLIVAVIVATWGIYAPTSATASSIGSEVKDCTHAMARAAHYQSRADKLWAQYGGCKATEWISPEIKKACEKVHEHAEKAQSHANHWGKKVKEECK